MLLPLGTHRHIEPIVITRRFHLIVQTNVSFGSSPARASRTSDVSPPGIRRTKQTGGKDSNLQPTAHVRWDAVCKLLPLGAGR